MAFAPAHCIRFFAYFCHDGLRASTLYSVFRLHLAWWPSRQHIVFGFSLTFGPVAFAPAHCVRFFAYIWYDGLRASTLSVFSFSHTIWSNLMKWQVNRTEILLSVRISVIWSSNEPYKRFSVRFIPVIRFIGDITSSQSASLAGFSTTKKSPYTRPA